VIPPSASVAIASLDQFTLSGVFGSLVWAFIGWFIWSAVTYFVGTSLFNGKATLDQMLRVISFAYAPDVLAIIPCCGWIVGWIWSLVAGFLAVRQRLDLDNINACATIVVGFILYVIGFAILSLLGFGIGFIF
jgi:hypothetical protein